MAVDIVGKHIASPVSKEEPTHPNLKNLISNQPNMELKDEVVNLKKVAAMLKMGIHVIDLFQKVAKATEMVLPSPLGDVLEKVTEVLQVLKVSSFCTIT